MQIAVASFNLKDGITESAMLAASDRFEEEFVQQQPGILRRIVVKDQEGYADIVFFEDAQALAAVMEAERDSPACVDLFSLVDGGTHRLFEVVTAHE